MDANEWIKYIDETFNGECLDMFSRFNQGEFKILTIIASRESITASDIAKIAHVSAARMSKIIHHLKSQGLIRCVNHKLDKRKVIITATEKGKKLYEDGRNFMAGMFAKLKEELGEEALIGFLKTSKAMKRIFLESSNGIIKEIENA